MNELTFVLAILIYQGILTKEEARKLLKAHSEGVINADLKQMVTKVEKALTSTEESLKKVDAATLIK